MKDELLSELYDYQELLEKIAPTWMNISLKMKKDQETDKAFGWVLVSSQYKFMCFALPLN